MISAIILAAGKSTRMGRPKMLLPWGHTTVLGRVVECLQHAEIQDILIITGSVQAEVEKVASNHGVRTVHNSSFERKEMLASIQRGLLEQKAEILATLICLGDQPQIEEPNVRSIAEAFHTSKSNLVVPSYRMRRGHPWLLARSLWDEFLNIHSPQSPRDFLNAHAQEIEYVLVDTPSVVEDIDAPEDYLKFKPSV